MTRLVIMLLLAMLFPAHAQSFDGVYNGAVTLTKFQRTGDGASPCPPPGHKIPVVFTVAGSTITARNLQNNSVSSGPVAADGSFSVTYGAGFWGGGPRSGNFPVTWSGRIRGSRIEGSLIVRGASGQCFGVLAARR